MLAALLSLSFWCLVIVVWLFLMVSWICLQFVIVVFPDHTHFLFVIVISFMARLGFRDKVWFGLCNFLVTVHVIFVQSSTSMVCKLTSCDVDS